MKVYAINLRQLFKEPLKAEHVDYISPEQAQKLSRYRFFEDQVRSLYSEMLIRTILVQNYGMDNQNIVFGQNAYGKPFVEKCPELHFNISHAGEWVVCALGDQPVGIDVEAVKPIDYDITNMVFSAVEKEVFAKIPHHEKEQFFYKIWTRKESYIKAVGIGLSLGVETFSVLEDTVENQKTHETWHIRSVDLQARCQVAVCTSKPFESGSIQWIGF